MTNTKAYACAYGSGVLFSAAWWLVGDGASNTANSNFRFTHILPLFVICFAFWSLNSFSWGNLSSLNGSNAARMRLVIGLVLGIFSVLGTVWILSSEYKGFENQWPGLSIVLGAVLMFASAVIYRAGSIDPDAI